MVHHLVTRENPRNGIALSRLVGDALKYPTIGGVFSSLVINNGDGSAALSALGLSGVFSVTDYGATGDGVTDDTTAIQNATDAAEAAGGGIVFFPPGQYKITDTVVNNSSNVFLIGAGAGQYDAPIVAAATELLWYGASGGTMHEFRSDGVTVAVRGGIQGIAFAGRNLAGRLIQIRDRQHFHLQDIAGKEATVWGIEVTNTPGTVNPTGFGRFDDIFLLQRPSSSAGCLYLNGVGSGAEGVTICEFHSISLLHADGDGLTFSARADGHKFFNLYTFRANTETGYGVKFEDLTINAVNGNNVFDAPIITGGVFLPAPNAATSFIDKVGVEFRNINTTELNSSLTDRTNPFVDSIGHLLVRGHTERNRRIGMSRMLHEHQGVSFDPMRFMLFDAANLILHTADGAWRVARVGTGTPSDATQPGGAVQLQTSAAANDDISLIGTPTYASGITLSFNPFIHFSASTVDIADVVTQMGLFADNTAGSPADGVYVECDPATSANWRLVSRKSSTSTVITTSVAIAAQIRHWLIYLDASLNVVFLTKLPADRDWAFLGTISTNVPTAAVSPQFRVTTTTTAVKSLFLYSSEYGHINE